MATSTFDESAHPRGGDGQFSTKQRSESDEVDLGEGAGGTAGPGRGTSDYFAARAAGLFNDVSSLTEDLVDATEEHSLVQMALSVENPAHAEVAYINVRGYDQDAGEFRDDGPDAWMSFSDAEGRALPGGGVAPFRPALLSRADGDSYADISIDVEQARTRDLETLRRQTEVALISRISNEHMAEIHQASYDATQPHLDAAAQTLHEEWGESLTEDEVEAVRAEIIQGIAESNVPNLALGFDRRAAVSAKTAFKHAVLDRPRHAPTAPHTS